MSCVGWLICFIADPDSLTASSEATNNCCHCYIGGLVPHARHAVDSLIQETEALYILSNNGGGIYRLDACVLGRVCTTYQS